MSYGAGQYRRSFGVPGSQTYSRKDVIEIFVKEQDYMTLPLSRTRGRRRREAVCSRTLVELDRSPPTMAGIEQAGMPDGRSIEPDMVRNTKWLGMPRNLRIDPTSSYQDRTVKPNLHGA